MIVTNDYKFVILNKSNGNKYTLDVSARSFAEALPKVWIRRNYLRTRNKSGDWDIISAEKVGEKIC